MPFLNAVIRSNMAYNHRKLIRKVKNRLVVDEEKLDIFWKYQRKNTKWTPSREIKPYDELKRIVVDIETSGLNPIIDRIFAIGNRNESSDVNVFMHQDERKILKEFVNLVGDTKPEALFTYNGMNFDLPFIIKRCQALKIKHPFKIGSKEIVIPTAKPYGCDPLRIYPIYIQNGIEHVDVYICVLRWDNARRRLSDGKSLKKVAIEMGLRDEARLVLEYEDILKCWDEGEGSHGWAQIEKYLRFDLEDTAFISDKIVPNYYYEKYIAPDMSLGQLSIKGNGTKWSTALQSVYNGAYPTPEHKYEFQGGLTYAKSGLFNNKPIAQCDINGMHPWIITNYGLFSKHDTEEISLAILDFFGFERELVRNIPELSNRQDALKSIRNCYYGLLGTGKLPFNDMEAAALVCAYSRRLLKFMVEIMEEIEAEIIEYDTDGIYFAHDNPQLVHQQLQAKLPADIQVKLENFAKAMFVPENGCKNYLLWTNDGKIVKKGSWTSRAKSQIENEHPINYLTHFLTNYETAERYHSSVIDLIQSGKYPINKLIIKRRIKDNEVELRKLGNPRDLVSYYVGINGICVSGEYSKSYYCNLVNTKRAELLQLIAPERLKSVQQFSLF